MKAPDAHELRGLWLALNIAEASPIGGDIEDENAADAVAAAIDWLKRNQPLFPRIPAGWRNHRQGM